MAMAKPSSAKEQDNLVCQDVIRNGLDRAVDVTQTSQGRSANCPRPHEPSRQRAAHRFSQARREATTLKSPEPDTTKSEAYFDSALSVARKQQAKSWELRAAMSMARLWREQGKQKEAAIMRSLLQLCHSPPALAVAVLLFAFALGTARAASPAASAAQGDFAGFVDIGSGRRLYLECRGTGSPVVVLEAGYRSAARIWSEDLHQPGAPRTMVLAGVAVFTRVCAYDRPGTVAALNDNVRQSRSDPAPMPRTAQDVVADLHALLRAAGVPAPYVFAGHSLGGLFVRLYASTYPRDVLGLVLVDAYSEMLETRLTPERWAALVRCQRALRQ